MSLLNLPYHYVLFRILPLLNPKSQLELICTHSSLYENIDIDYKHLYYFANQKYVKFIPRCLTIQNTFDNDPLYIWGCMNYLPKIIYKNISFNTYVNEDLFGDHPKKCGTLTILNKADYSIEHFMENMNARDMNQKRFVLDSYDNELIIISSGVIPCGYIRLETNKKYKLHNFIMHRCRKFEVFSDKIRTMTFGDTTLDIKIFIS